LAAAILWSLNGLFIKSLGSGGLGGCSIACYRSLLAAVALAPFTLGRWRRVAHPGWLVATVVAFTGMCVTFVVATTMTSAANAIILQYTAPAWVFLCSPFILGEPAQPRQWLALGGAMMGVSVIFFTQISSDAAGLGVALLSGLVFGVQSVLFRKVRDVHPIVLAFLACAGSGLALLWPALAIEGRLPTRGQGGLLVAMAVVQFALPYVLYSAAVARVRAQEAILIIMLEPVLNPVWVWMGRGEVPSTGTLIGGGIILLSITYLSLARSPRGTLPKTV
jgi:drug/metabolite transporter (DMT)-like permease